MTRKRVAILFVALLLTVCLPASPVLAGSFVPSPPVFDESTLESAIFARAYGSATYLGVYDQGDNSWFIRTFINDTWGNDMDDWSNPDFWGNGANGVGIYPGLVITCGFYCAAAGHIPRPGVNMLRTYYWGRNATSIYHQFFPEISEAFSPWYEVPKIQRPDACPSDIRGEVTALGLNEGHGLTFEGVSELTRSDELEGQTYLLEEWTLLEADRSGLRALASSSNMMTDSVSRSPPQLDSNVPAPTRFLVIQYPGHPHNARHIELPEMRLENGPIPGGPQNLWVRADFALSGEVRVAILWSDLQLDQPIERELASGLKLGFVSDKKHRVIAFANVEIDASGKAHIRSHFLYLAVCCCEEWPYCPV